MNASEIAQCRLIHQQIASTQCKQPADVVGRLGAMQAQDYSSALWAIGLRLPDATEASVEQAIAGRTIVRTWPMRGTLHFVAADDVRWMLELLTPRVIASNARRFQRFELDDAVFACCRKLFTRALENGRQLTRDAMLQLLERHGISTASQRGYVILCRLAQEGMLCFGERSGKQPTFALLDEWIPCSKKLERDAALAELARRYFNSHGPATLQDFVWWTGLKVSDARAGLESIASELSRQNVDGTNYWMPGEWPARMDTPVGGHLLPGFDEYLIGYKNRGAVLESRHAQKVVPGNNGMFLPIFVINGWVSGTWKRAVKKNTVAITINPFSARKNMEKEVSAAAERFGRFIGKPVEI